MPLVCTHDVGVAARFAGCAKRHAERGRGRALARVDVDELDLDAGDARREPGHETADRAGADDGDAIADTWRARPTAAFTAVSRFAASTARAGGTSSGSACTASAGTT